jgi:predicted dehydrogenase
MNKNIVLIGYGSIGHRHAKAINNTGYNKIILDQNEESRELAREQHPDAIVVSNLSEINKEDINWGRTGGVVATWAPSHKHYFEKLADLGVKRILCEKPLANSIEAATSMCRRAKRDNIRLLVNHKFRYSKELSEIRKLASEYDLGEPVQFVSVGGAVGLINNGTHRLDLAIGLLENQPIKVVSTARGEDINPRSDDLKYYGGTSVWSFDNGREAVISYSNKSSISLSHRIYYKDGLISLSMDGSIYVRHRNPEEIEEYPEITRHGTASEELYSAPNLGVVDKVSELKRAHQDLMSNSEPVSPASLGKDAIEACIAGLISSKEEKAVSLPLSEQNSYWNYEWPYN